MMRFADYEIILLIEYLSQAKRVFVCDRKEDISKNACKNMNYFTLPKTLYNVLPDRLNKSSNLLSLLINSTLVNTNALFYLEIYFFTYEGDIAPLFVS